MTDTVEIDRELLAEASMLLRQYASGVQRRGNRNGAKHIEDLADSLSENITDPDKE